MALNIRARLPGTPQPATITVTDPSAPVTSLYAQISATANIPVAELKILAGFPPREIPFEKRGEAISSLFRNNDVVNVQRGEATMRQGHTEGKYIPPVPERAVFVRRDMPGDNSCFFHTMAYTLENKTTGKDAARAMRQKAAQFVAANPTILPDHILGMANRKYVEWISQDSSWGGELELLIFSKLYRTEIVAIDLESLRLHHMGQGEGFTTRVYCVYTGTHYDAIAVVNAIGGSGNDDQVMFSSGDAKCHEQAVKWIKFELAKKK